MRARLPAAERLLGAAAALVGVIGVGSALTPELASRIDLVEAVLPAGFPGAARFLTLAFGLALVWLSRSLAHRRRRAWQLAVVLVIGIALTHLAKGLDAEEATVSLLLLAALIHWRGRFDVPGDRAFRPLVAVGLALTSLLGLLAAVELHRLSAPEELEDVVGVASFLLAVRAFYLWLRPLTQRVRQTVGEHACARRLVESHGRDSLAYFALRRDKTYFFAPGERAFLAYRVVAGSALVSGDPVGEEDEFPSLLADFRRMAHANGWRVAVLGASAERLPVYRALGLRAVKLGDEAVVRPATFSLEGRKIRKVRQSVHRLGKAGYRVRVLSAGEMDADQRDAVRALAAQARGRWPERGFTMAMDDFFGEAGGIYAVAEDPHGTLGGFLHLVPAPASGGYSLSAMRRRRDTPNGLMEFLIAETIAWARVTGVPELSLNFCVFADFLRAGSVRSPAARVLSYSLHRLDRAFQLERLLRFSGKFFPEWRPRFLCIERLSDFPSVGIAYLRAESLLTPPGPWVRARTPV
ncbi:MAG TPA: phosphatidylglycerol lysyltransferase domain-containing protein [Gaiellaceae bacterium]|jgi:lysyl-tRNA synthetase class 2